MRQFFEPLAGTVYAYATFVVGARNPISSPGGATPRTAVVTLSGTAREGPGLLRVVRFGLADGRRCDPGNTQLVPWASNGRIGFYGDHARPNTRYTMRVRIGAGAGAPRGQPAATGSPINTSSTGSWRWRRPTREPTKGTRGGSSWRTDESWCSTTPTTRRW